MTAHTNDYIGPCDGCGNSVYQRGSCLYCEQCGYGARIAIPPLPTHLEDSLVARAFDESIRSGRLPRRIVLSWDEPARPRTALRESARDLYEFCMGFAKRRH